MPGHCCCASFCVLCRKRKQFDDNILLVANGNNVDSPDRMQKGREAKKLSSNKSISKCKIQCETCEKLKKKCKKCEQSYDQSKTNKINTNNINT